MPSGPVLIVDDDADIRDTIVEVLESAGIRATSAKDGVQALALLDDGLRPCVILLDLMMPGMDGIHFRAEQARREALSEIPVVIISAFREAPDVAASLEAEGILKKPFEFGELMSTVQRFCPQPVQAH